MNANLEKANEQRAAGEEALSARDEPISPTLSAEDAALCVKMDQLIEIALEVQRYQRALWGISLTAVVAFGVLLAQSP